MVDGRLTDGANQPDAQFMFRLRHGMNAADITLPDASAIAFLGLSRGTEPFVVVTAMMIARDSDLTGTRG